LYLCIANIAKTNRYSSVFTVELSIHYSRVYSGVYPVYICSGYTTVFTVLANGKAHRFFVPAT